MKDLTPPLFGIYLRLADALRNLHSRHQKFSRCTPEETALVL